MKSIQNLGQTHPEVLFQVSFPTFCPSSLSNAPAMTEFLVIV